MDRNAIKTLVQLINPAIQLESATEDYIPCFLEVKQRVIFTSGPQNTLTSLVMQLSFSIAT